MGFKWFFGFGPVIFKFGPELVGPFRILICTSAYFSNRYFSADSVCIPRLFVTTNDKSWPFSIFITLFNFISFLYMLCAYIFIIYKARMPATCRRAVVERTGKLFVAKINLCHFQLFNQFPFSQSISFKTRQFGRAIMRSSLERRPEIQIGHSVANGSPPMRHFFEKSCVACRHNNAEMGLANSLHASA